MAAANKAVVVRWMRVATVCSVLLLSTTPSLANPTSCTELGFSSSLLCSSCRELKQFGLEVLEDECKQCCQADQGAASEEKVISGNYKVILCSF